MIFLCQSLCCFFLLKPTNIRPSFFSTGEQLFYSSCTCNNLAEIKYAWNPHNPNLHACMFIMQGCKAKLTVQTNPRRGSLTRCACTSTETECCSPAPNSMASRNAKISIPFASHTIPLHPWTDARPNKRPSRQPKDTSLQLQTYQFLLEIIEAAPSRGTPRLKWRTTCLFWKVGGVERCGAAPFGGNAI